MAEQTDAQWFADDRNFLGYVELHARTDLALFHRKHVERLLKLAGEDVPHNLREWTSVHSHLADPLVTEARRRLDEAQGALDVEHVHNL